MTVHGQDSDNLISGICSHAGLPAVGTGSTTGGMCGHAGLATFVAVPGGQPLHHQWDAGMPRGALPALDPSSLCTTAPIATLGTESQHGIPLTPLPTISTSQQGPHPLSQSTFGEARDVRCRNLLNKTNTQLTSACSWRRLRSTS